MKNRILLLLLFLATTQFKINAQTFTEGFEGATFPPTGWSIINNGDPNTWFQGPISASISAGHTGSFVAQINYNSSTAHEDYLITPSYVVTSTADSIIFWAQNRDDATFPEEFDVVVSTTTNTSASDFTNTLAANVAAPAAWTRYAYSLGAFNGQTIYVAIKATSLDMWQLYLDDISIVTNCSGIPNIGNITGSNNICPNTSFTLNLSNSVPSGTTLQWQSSPSGAGTFTNISGAVGSSYSTSLTSSTDYRCIALCTNSGQYDTTNVFPISVNTFASCYCITNLGGSCGGNNIVDVSLNTLNNTGTTCTTTANGAYTSYANTGISNHTTSLSKSSSYSISVNCSGSSIVSVWIDYDQSGTFDASEWTQVYTNASSGTVSITIPSTAVLGNTGMRVRSRAFGNNNGSTDACTNFGSGETEDYIVTITPAASCINPTNVQISSLLATSCNVSWTAPSTPAVGYEWKLVAGGSGVSGTAIQSGNSTITSTSLSSLTANTSYDIYVRAICAPGDTSFWSPAGSFRTPCVALISFPWTETFEPSSTTEACWKVINVNNDADSFDLNYTSNPFGGLQSAILYTDGNSGANNDYLVSPLLNIPTGTNYQLRYYTRAQSTTEPNDYKVLLSTTGSNSANFTTTLLTDTSDQTTYEEKIISLAGYSGNIYLAFHVPSGGYDGWRLYFDDVTIEPIPTCPVPTALTNSSVTDTSASLNWTENGTATQWIIEYGAQGFTQGTGIKLTVNSKPYTLSGLSPITKYTYYVRSVCSPSDSSTWSAIANNFTTACPASYTPTYIQNFTVYPADCWSEATGTLTSNTTVTGTSSTWSGLNYLNGSSNLSARINIYGSSSVVSEWLISPTINLGTAASGPYQLEFNLGLTQYLATTADTLGSDDTLAVVISTNNGASWSNTNILRKWTAADYIPNTGQRIAIPLTGYTGLVKIGFYGTSTLSNKDNDVFIDSFVIKPVTIDAGVTTLTATPSSICGGDSVALSINITNNGSDPISNVPVSVQLANANPSSISYTYTGTINVGATTTAISLGKVKAANSGTLTAKAYTTYAQDVNHTNDSSSTSVSITAFNPLVVSTNDTICNGGSTTLTASGGTTYTWSNGANTASINVSPSTTTLYTVTVSNGICSVAVSKNIIVNSKPNLAFTLDTACQGSLTHLIDLSTGVNPAGTYQIDYSIDGSIDSTVSVGNKNNIFANSTTARYYHTNQYGCKDTQDISIVVNPKPNLSFIIDTVCQGNTTHLIDLSINLNAAGTYEIDYGINGSVDSTVSVGNKNNIFTTSTTARYYHTNQYGCKDTQDISIVVNPKPNLTFTVDTVCEAKVTHLLDLSTGVNPAGTYQIDYSVDGSIDSTISVGNKNNIFAASTTARYYHTNQYGCKDTQDISIVIKTNPILVTTSDSVCLGNSATLTASGANSYVWSNTISGATNTVLVNTTTPYTVTATAVNGCTAVGNATATIKATPNISAIGDTICSGDTATITATGASNYTWNTGQTTSVIKEAPLTASTYVVISTNPNGCADTATAIVLVNTTPNISLNSQTICSGNSVTLTANVISGTVASYNWDNGLGTGNPKTTTPTSTATYTVTATSAAGCIDTAQGTITVNTSPTVTATGANIFIGQSATITATGANGNYVWSNGNTGASITVSPLNSTVYTVTGYNTNGCFDTATATVFVNTSSAYTLNATNICKPGLPATLIGSGTGMTFTWAGLGAGNVKVVYPTATTTYQVTITNASGFYTVDSVKVTLLLSPSNVYIAGLDSVYCINAAVDTAIGVPSGGVFGGLLSGRTFSPSTFGVGTYLVSYIFTSPSGCVDSVGMSIRVDSCNQVSTSSVSNQIQVLAYPTPFSNELKVQFSIDNTATVTIQLTDITGKIIQEQKAIIQSGKDAVSIQPNIASGMYFIHITGLKEKIVLPVIKE